MTWQRSSQPPRAPGNYALIDPAGRVVYIGTSYNLAGRHKRHEHMREGFQVAFRVMKSDRARRERECRLIARLNPPLNRRVRGRRVPLLCAGCGRKLSVGVNVGGHMREPGAKLWLCLSSSCSGFWSDWLRGEGRHADGPYAKGAR